MLRIFLFTVFFTFGCCENLEVDIKSKCGILINGNTGAILYEKNANSLHYPASVTKIASVLFVLEHASDITLPMTATKEALKPICPKLKIENEFEDPSHLLETDGTMMHLKEGEQISLRSLLYGMMLISGNDASNVVAQEFGGTIGNFVEELNTFVKEVGCNNTNFCNPHGLHHPEHVSTAYDLAFIAKRAFMNPFFKKLAIAKNYFLPKTNLQPQRQINQKNRMINKGKFYYPYAIGGKSGYHKKAKYNLMCAAEKNDRFLIAVVLGAPSSDQRYKDIQKLFDTAFSERLIDHALISENKVFEREIEGGQKNLLAKLKKEIKIQYYPSEKQEDIKAFIHWDKEVSFPIQQGEKVGEVKIMTKDNQVLLQEDLVAKEDLSATILYRITSFLTGLF